MTNVFLSKPVFAVTEEDINIVVQAFLGGFDFEDLELADVDSVSLVTRDARVMVDFHAIYEKHEPVVLDHLAYCQSSLSLYELDEQDFETRISYTSDPEYYAGEISEKRWGEFYVSLLEDLSDAIWELVLREKLVSLLHVGQKIVIF